MRTTWCVLFHNADAMQLQWFIIRLHRDGGHIVSLHHPSMTQHYRYRSAKTHAMQGEEAHLPPADIRRAEMLLDCALGPSFMSHALADSTSPSTVSLIYTT